MSTDAEWDARYFAAPEGMFSGNVNGTLAVEVADLAPGTALDIGCGEGADAIWLARAGWDVTGLDVSAVAVQRAEGAARAAGVDVRWLVGDFATTELDPFDLVTTHYPALEKTPDRTVLRALAAAVTPGGTLLYVGHAPLEREAALARGFDPDGYVLPKDVSAFLDDRWEIEVAETRPRPGGAPHGSAFTHDDVLRARRLR
ncbi:methyltransferase domain-containing protein [Solirubrobacter sp. CPCC 204708]|uniref:Methyltransferase domain-containing protein n=1 Tax=Solirubrobacter deserti TaxID=2282478 RepID=A0ABT4RKQ6_9ACTN|nr:class I SAM-dependent methyltransferase [Solirubrobacter deserti]MBE2315799.1 methyltransferase domain-containing protein [Solirubrobacter deserti]MDA0138865.1 methyltransferase domain-containing protein [Solirubrobacter deserti]